MWATAWGGSGPSMLSTITGVAAPHPGAPPANQANVLTLVLRPAGSRGLTNDACMFPVKRVNSMWRLGPRSRGTQSDRGDAQIAFGEPVPVTLWLPWEPLEVKLGNDPAAKSRQVVRPLTSTTWNAAALRLQGGQLTTS